MLQIPIFFFNNSLIMYGIIHQIEFGYIDVLPFKILKSDIKTTQTIINNLINENILPLIKTG